MAPIGFIQSELDLKLLVLYIMDRAAGPLSFLQLLELALCDAGVDYFSLTQAVNHMVETGQLSREGDIYTITEKGRRNSEICQDVLPYSVRMHCDENLVQVNQEIRRQAQIKAEVRDHEDGTCNLHLQFNDENTPLLSVDLLVPDRAGAAAMAARFRNDPAAIYHAVVALLSGENSSGKENGHAQT